MNIVKRLSVEKEAAICLERFESDNFTTKFEIKLLIEHEDFIREYFETRGLNVIGCFDDYVDYLFLQHISSFAGALDSINESFITKIQGIISFSNEMMTEPRKNVADYIRGNYKEIFNSDVRFYGSGLKKRSIKLFATNYKRVKDEGILDFLIEKKAVFVFDNLQSLKKIFKTDERYNEELFRNQEQNLLPNMRFNELCNYMTQLYRDNKRDLANKIEELIFGYIERLYESRYENEIYYLNQIIPFGSRALCAIKSNRFQKINKMQNVVEKEIKEILQKKGSKFTYELDEKSYFETMKTLEEKNVHPFARFLTISHCKNEDNEWYSILEDAVERHQPSFVDHIFFYPDTNSYFTHSKQNLVKFCTEQKSLRIEYWLNNKDRISEFANEMEKVICSIYEMVGFKYDEKEVTEDIDSFVNIISNKGNDEIEKEIIHMKSLFVITFFEKVLRQIYIGKDREGIFLISSVTLGSLLGSSEGAGYLREEIGVEHHRWTRYYFLNEGKYIGLDYRNRLMHFRDIKVGDISIVNFNQIVWMVISTINSIYFNLAQGYDGEVE